jgi:MscS family membrane protein
VAFAAQKTLENLFGGFMIASDQPIRVGDYCRAGEHSGTVENIGLRSTRIRTVGRTVVSVPNGQLSTMSLENFALRDKILFHHTVGLRCETTGEQVRAVLQAVRRMLDERPDVEADTSRVRLVSVSESGFDMEIFAYVLVTSWEAYLEAQEEMLLHVVDVVEANGAAFASNRLALPLVVPQDKARGRDDKARKTKDKDGSQMALPGT